MGASSKQKWTKHPALIVMFILFVVWMFWYFKIDENVDTKSLESGYILPQLIQTIDNKTEHKIKLLTEEIQSLKQQNSEYQTSYHQLEHEKEKMLKQINQLQTKTNEQNDATNTKSLLHELKELKIQTANLKEKQQDAEMRNNQLTQQMKQLKIAKSVHKVQGNIDPNATNYYFLYGYCNEKKRIDPHVYVIMDQLRAYISKQYTHWNILNISVQDFLNKTNFSYTHDKLMRFTQSTIPYLDINKDKFQWIFEPHCREFYKDLKTYYRENVTSTMDVELPKDLYQYYNINRTGRKFNDRERFNPLGYVDDDDRDVALSHIVNINHHKYNNTFTGKEYYLDIPETDRVLNIWQNNTYYTKSGHIPMSLGNNRPFLMGISGEAFDSWIVRKRFRCDEQDFHIQRTQSWPIKGCIVSQYVQGIIQRDIEYDKRGRHTEIMNYKKLIISNKKPIRDEYIDKAIKQKTNFCSFTVKTLIVWGHYLGDALVRHVLHHMISTQYKYCDMLGGYHHKKQNKSLLCHTHNPRWKGKQPSHHLLAECQQIFKFSINMENTATYGYTSEKIYTGLIANTIPIYFGNKDVDKIVNMESIIFCDIDDFVLIKNRKEFKRIFRESKQKYGDVNINGTASALVGKALLKWAIDTYGPHLQSCVDEIIRVDQNDTLYRYKLSQPKVPNNTFKNTHYDGTTLSKAIIDTLAFLKSPLFD